MRPRVLLADADRESLDRSRADLLAGGFDVIAVASALDCLARLRDSGPDVLVMDPRLPWGSGEGVLALMREGRGLRRLPVLILADLRELPGDASTFGDCAVMSKPVPPAALAMVVRTLAEAGRRSGRSARDPGLERG